jgi:hypothetical protein
VVLLLPLSLAMNNGEFDHSGGGGGSGGSLTAAAAGVVVVDNRDWWQWRWMSVIAIDGDHTTASWCSKRAAQ